MPVDRRKLSTLRRRLLRGLEGIAVELTNQARVRATRHVFTGEYRNAVTHAVKTSYVLWGLPATPKNMALELGFKPHWVPASRIGVWMRRNNVGILTFQRASSRGRRRTYRFLSAGLFVGGPGSRLEQGPGQPGGYLFGTGGKRVFRRWNTRGGRGPDLKPNSVGFSIVQHTVRTRARIIAAPAFLRGYNGGR